MPTELNRIVGELEQTRDDIAQIIRDRGSYIAPATKIKDLVPYIRSFAQQELEEGVVTPSTLGIDMYPSEGYVGFSKVTVNPIPYQRKDTDVTVDGATVNIPYGYFKSSVQKSVASGSATTPATTITVNPSLATTYTSGSGYKMTVSKTQSVTPSVSAGYVSSGTAGTITVSGSAYVPQSSTGSATASTTDTATRNIGYGQQTTIGAGYYPNNRIVRNSVAAGSAKTPADTITATNTVTIDENGLITATASGSKSITPTVKAGYVSSGTAGTVSVSGTGTRQLTKRTSSDLTVSGATVTAPAGYYPNAASTTIPATMPPTITFTAEADDEEGEIHVRATATQSAGYAKGGSTYNDVFPKLTVSGDAATMECNGAKITRRVASATQATPSITVSSTGLITASATQTEGYVSAGTESITEQLTTQAGKTVTPTTSNQTAVASGRYTTGAITVKGDSNLVAGNIKKGVSIFGVTGTHEGGASIATCNVTLTFGASVGYVRVVATTFANGAFGTSSQYKSSGTFTLENVVCGSVISLGGYNNFDVSKGYSGNSGYFSDSAYWIAAPSTAGNYTAQIIAYED